MARAGGLMRSQGNGGVGWLIREPTMNKPRGRPFEAGNKFGRGRPKGSRNREKSPGQHELEEYALHLVRKCITMAMRGDQSALRMCMERISPARRGALIQMNLPPIRTAQDVDRAAEKVTQAIRRGKLTPAEGGTMMNVLEGRSRIIVGAQFEGRLQKVEEKMAA